MRLWPVDERRMEVQRWPEGGGGAVAGRGARVSDIERAARK